MTGIPDAIEEWFAAAGPREAELRRVDELVRGAAPGIDRQLVPAGPGQIGKSCIRFPDLDRVDTDALADLVRDAVTATAEGRNASAQG